MSVVPLAASALPSFCAIDFGTSNSAIAIADAQGQARLVDVEAGQRTLPTAVFFGTESLAPQESPRRSYGRAALAAYMEGHEGRLMRSMKSALGTSLIEQHTDVGGGYTVTFLDVIAGTLRHLRQQAQRELAQRYPQASAEDIAQQLRRVVLGRPVFFVDGDPLRDAQAQAALEAAARQVGFEEVAFQFEPIAAALDYEAHIEREELVLVADIGGGTSDFSVVRVGPQQRQHLERGQDILASHGVHTAGTDFDRQVELAALLPLAGYKARGPKPAEREVPSRVYFDLATWHLINTVYTPPRVAELRRMKSFYADAEQHARLLRIIDQRLGHALLAQAEAAKIAVAEGGLADLQLPEVAPGWHSSFNQEQALACIEPELVRIVEAARHTAQLAGVAPERIDTVYLTGGSTGLAPLAQRLAAPFSKARTVRGDRLASVAQGLGLHAQRVFA